MTAGTLDSGFGNTGLFDASVAEEGLGQADAAFGAQRGFGASPDGIGAYQSDPDQSALQQAAAGAHQYDHIPDALHQQMQGQIDFIEPEDASPEAGVRSGGFTLLLVAVAAGAGYAWKGGLGAASAVLMTGAAANIYRAQKWFSSPEPSEKHEAMVSAVFGVAGLGAGGYVGYKAFQEAKTAG